MIKLHDMDLCEFVADMRRCGVQRLKVDGIEIDLGPAPNVERLCVHGNQMDAKCPDCDRMRGRGPLPLPTLPPKPARGMSLEDFVAEEHGTEG